MAGRRKLARPVDPRSVPGRICILLDKVWNGSQAEMAADLDLRPATMSNVLNRRRAPGRLLLERLAAHPSVNEKWLRTGRGTPQRVEPEAECRMVPVASRLLPGPPARYADELTQESFPVPASDFHPGLYFVVADRSICDEPGLAGHIQAGDKILFDADPGRWMRDVDSTEEKFCAVRKGRGKLAQVHLRGIRRDRSEDGGVRLRIGSRDPVRGTTPVEQKHDKPLRAIWSGLRPPEAAASPVVQQESDDTVAETDILAVAVMLIRGM